MLRIARPRQQKIAEVLWRKVAIHAPTTGNHVVITRVALFERKVDQDTQIGFPHCPRPYRGERQQQCCKHALATKVVGAQSIDDRDNGDECGKFGVDAVTPVDQRFDAERRATDRDGRDGQDQEERSRQQQARHGKLPRRNQ